MPLDLFLSRGPSSVDHGGRSIDQPTLENALHEAGANFTPAATGEDALWVRYPESISVRAAGELWFRARVLHPGVVHLAASYSNPRLIRNGIDLLLFSFQLARILEARVFESEHARLSEATLVLRSPGVETRLRIEGKLDEHVVRAGKAEAAGAGAHARERLLEERHVDAIRADWTQSLAATLRYVHDVVDRRPVGALEVPVGALDVVPEYAVVEVGPARAVSPGELTRALAAAGTRAEVADNGVISVFDGESVAALAIQKPDGRWQFWPSHARAPWPIIFATSMKLGRMARAHGGGGTLHIGHVLVDDALERAAHDFASKTGVEFFVWSMTRQHGIQSPDDVT